MTNEHDLPRGPNFFVVIPEAGVPGELCSLGWEGNLAACLSFRSAAEESASVFAFTYH
jgi:hypothetical protein